MHKFGRWSLAILLLGAGALAGWAAAATPQPSQRPESNPVRAVAYLGELGAGLAEHHGALYRALAAPDPQAARELDRLEGYLGEGADWLDRRGMTGPASALKSYLQAVAGARRAGRDEASAALTGPVYQAMVAARSALAAAADRLGVPPAPASSQGTPQRDLLALLSLLCGLGAFLAWLAGMPEPSPAPDRPAGGETLTGARLRAQGVAHSGAAAAAALVETASAVEELRADLEAAAALSDTHAAQASTLEGAAGRLHRSLGRMAAHQQARHGAGARLAGEVGDLAEAVGHLASRAGATDSGAAQLHHAAASATAMAETASRATAALQERAARTAETLGALAERAGQIESVLAVIKSIAAQTNMLALNAAVEAARAGERGRGFAVVAESVRKLALEVQRRAQEIDLRVAGLSQSAVGAAGEVRRLCELAETAAATVQDSRAGFARAAALSGSEDSSRSALLDGLRAAQARAEAAAAALASSVQAAAASDSAETVALHLGSEARDLVFTAAETAIAIQEMHLEAGLASGRAGQAVRTARELERSASRVADELRTACEPKG